MNDNDDGNDDVLLTGRSYLWSRCESRVIEHEFDIRSMERKHYKSNSIGKCDFPLLSTFVE